MAKKNIKQQINKSKVQAKQQNLKDDKQKIYLFLGFAILLTAIVFSNIMGGRFLTWDDNMLVPDNPDIKALNLVNLKRIFTGFYIGMYQPFTTLGYALIYHFFKLDPAPYHFFSLLFHLFNVALVFYLMITMTGRKELALIVSVFFGIHPMHVESVAWIAEFKDVLYGFFFIASLILYVRFIQKKSAYLYVFSVLLFICSLFSKSAAVTLPVLLILFDFYFDRKLISKNVILEKIPFFILSILFGLKSLQTQSAENAIVDITPLFSIIDRFFLVSYSTSYYIVKLFIPTKLSTLHYYPIEPGKSFPLEYYMAPFFLIALIIGIIFSKRYRKLLIFGAMFYLITISLVLQVIPVGQAIVAERYTYIPYIGLLFVVAKIYCDVLDNKLKKSQTLKPYLTAILVIYGIIFSYATYERNKVWKDTVVLFTDVIDKDPKIFYSYTVRGGAFIEDKKYREGIADYEYSLKLQPNYYDPYFNLGKAYYYLGDLNKAISYYTKSIEMKPNFAQAYSNRGAAYFGLGHISETINDCNKAISLKPNYADAYVNRGNAKGMSKDYEGSIADFDKAISLDPSLKEAYINRGLSKVFLKRMSDGCSDFKTAYNMGDSNVVKLINQYCK